MGQNQSGGPYSSTGTQSPWESAHGEPQAATKEPPTPAPGQEAKDLQSSTSTDTEEHGETVRDASHTPQLGDSDPGELISKIYPFSNGPPLTLTVYNDVYKVAKRDALLGSSAELCLTLYHSILGN